MSLIQKQSINDGHHYSELCCLNREKFLLHVARVSVSSREGYFSLLPGLLFSLASLKAAARQILLCLAGFPPVKVISFFFLKNGFMKSVRSHFGEVEYTAADKQMNHVENGKDGHIRNGPMDEPRVSELKEDSQKSSFWNSKSNS